MNLKNHLFRINTCIELILLFEQTSSLKAAFTLKLSQYIFLQEKLLARILTYSESCFDYGESTIFACKNDL